MTTPVNKVPVSIDYTSRDYYSLRQELISRVQSRVPDWLGNDPSDFGVAIIEAFAYMGDILNYYIDRVANESYISTATQRDTLLNLASMYGYTPAGYVSAVTDIELTNNYGYNGQISGSILESGVAQIIVPNDHPFAVNDYATIAGVPTEVSLIKFGVTKKYNTSVYNGTYKITGIGLAGVGKNTISYKPEFTITGITVESPSGPITAASGDGTYVTYTTSTPPKVGSVVSITGVSPSSYNLTYVEVKNVTDNSFSVLSSVTDGYISPGSFTGSFVKISTASQIVAGQKIQIKNVVSSGSPANRYNGIWKVTNSTLTDVTLNIPANKCDITGVYGTGSVVVYSGDNDFVVGQTVTVTDLAPSGYNTSTPSEVQSVTNILATVTNATGSGTVVTYTVDKAFAANQLVTMTGINPSGYNLTNAVISGTANLTATITSIAYRSGTGDLLVTTSSNHGMVANSYVTISGNSVYNMGPVLITDVPLLNQFVINGSDLGSTGSGGTATVYKFTVSNGTSGTMIQGGYAKVAQFTLTNSTIAPVTDGVGTAVAVADGSYTSGGIINFADLPTIDNMGGLVYNIGTTLVPAGTELVADVTYEGVTEKVTFSTVTDANVPYKGTSTVSAIEGKKVSLLEENKADPTKLYDIDAELIGTSTGETDQSFSIANKIVDRSTIRVFVDNGTAFEEWTQVTDIIDYDSHDNVFSTSVDAQGVIYVNFGDGISGSIPLLDKQIKAIYIAGGGQIGNVNASTLTKFGSIPYKSVGTLPDGSTDLAVFIKKYISPNNLIPGNGGTDAESDDSIRFNAPRALRALNRAVSLKDFSDLSLSVAGVGKANAVAESANSVTLYIAPTGSDKNTDLNPGLSDDGITPTSSWEFLKTTVGKFLEDKTQIGTTVTISPPIYTKVYVSTEYTPLPQYSSDTVEKNISEILLNAFSYNYVTFEDVITPEEIEFKLRQVDGVANIKVTELYRDGGSGKNSLVGLPNEIFVFTEQFTSINPSSSEARLNNTGPTFAPYKSDGTSAGTAVLSPTYNQNVYSYRLALPNNTAKVRITPVAQDTDAKITVNNIEVTTANPYVEITTPVGNTVIKIIVTAGNGITIGTYTITANRVA